MEATQLEYLEEFISCFTTKKINDRLNQEINKKNKELRLKKINTDIRL